MIAFTCPECDTELEVPSSSAGTKVTCPECGRRVLVRGPASSRGVPEARRPQSRSRPAAGSSERRSSRPARDYPEQESRQKNLALIIALAGGGASLLLVLVVVVIFAVRSKNTVATTPVPQAPTLARRPDIPPPPPPAVNPVAGQQPEEKSNVTSVQPTEDVPRLGDTTSAAQDIHQHVLKSMAWIFVRVGDQAITGSGSLIDRENRLVLTNEHVAGKGVEIVVFFPVYQDGKLVTSKEAYLKQVKRDDVIRGRSVGLDAKRDLALIQVDRVPDGIEPLAIAATGVQPGQTIHSVGNTGASGGLWGYVQGRVRSVYHHKWKVQGEDETHDHEADVIETDSATNRGDSGGPLVNDRGELVGVTEGASIGANLVSHFIDRKEAIDFIEKTCRTINVAWARETRKLTPRSTASVADLVRFLESKDSKTRSQAVQALATLGPAAKVAVAGLLKILREDSDAVLRKMALETLDKIGAPDRADLPLLLDSLRDQSADARSYAASAIGMIGPEARSAIPSLLGILTDRDGRVRQSAARALGKLGGEAKESVFPALVAALQDAEKEVRLAAGEALATGGFLSAAEVPALIDLLKHEDSGVRAAAARALGQLGRDAKPAVLPLIEIVRNKNTDRPLRRASIEAMAQMGPDAKAALPIFIDALKDSDKETRKHASQALFKIGPDAKDAVPALADALGDLDKDVRKNAILALGKIGPAAKDGAKPLSDLLKEGDKSLRPDILNSLAAMGPGAKDALPNLILLFEEKDKDFVAKVAQTVGKIGKDAVKDLRSKMNSENPFVRYGAAVALGEIGPIAKDALPVLNQHATGDLDPIVRDAARNAASRIRAKP